MILRAAVIAVELAIKLCAMGEKTLELQEQSKVAAETGDPSTSSNGDSGEGIAGDALAA